MDTKDNHRLVITGTTSGTEQVLDLLSDIITQIRDRRDLTYLSAGEFHELVGHLRSVKTLVVSDLSLLEAMSQANGSP